MMISAKPSRSAIRQRRGGLLAALGILILGFAAAAGAQGAANSQPATNPTIPQAQPTQPTVSQPQTDPLGAQTPALQPGVNPTIPQAQPTQPTVSQPQTVPLGSPTPAFQPAAPVPAQTAAPAAVVVPIGVDPLKAMPGQEAPLGNDLRSKIKQDEQHFHEQSAAAKREFELRQAEERKTFEATLADKGFWESRKLKRKFRAAQAQQRREFDAEQAKKRRTYEWRYP